MIAKSPTPAPDTLPTITETQRAAALHKDPKTLSRWVAAGSGPSYYRLADRVHYSRADVLKWLAGRTHWRSGTDRDGRRDRDGDTDRTPSR